MEKNVGFADSFIRLLLAVVLFVLIIAGTLSGAAAWISALLAIVFLVTALVSWCPIWGVFGIRTKASSSN